MAECSAAEKNVERRRRVMVGNLPPDFLRITASSQQQQEAADQQAALALQQMVGLPYPQSSVGRLSITVVQAKLAKNYGIARMDPYVRLRVGHNVYETQTSHSGGKNPRWNKVVQCILPPGLNSIYLEIYDECAFTVDELIASANIPIPKSVMSGETSENWHPLDGKQGEGMEGMVHLVLSYSVAPGHYMYSPVAPVVMVPSTMYGVPRGSYPSVPIYQAPPQNALPPELTEQEIKQIEEMFPNMDKEAIKSVIEANRGNKTAIINSLLQMSE